jgi:hypothetical protein
MGEFLGKFSDDLIIAPLTSQMDLTDFSNNIGAGLLEEDP